MKEVIKFKPVVYDGKVSSWGVTRAYRHITHMQELVHGAQTRFIVTDDSTVTERNMRIYYKLKRVISKLLFIRNNIKSSPELLSANPVVSDLLNTINDTIVSADVSMVNPLLRLAESVENVTSNTDSEESTY